MWNGSEVRSIIYGPKKVIDDFVTHNAVLIRSVKDCMGEGCITVKTKGDTRFIHFHRDYVKWVPCMYDGPRSWEMLLDIAEKSDELEFEFIRLGESSEYAEERASSQAKHYIGVRRETTFS